MSFLAPWFLLGALAVAGPVLFHLIRRSARERMPFSSLLFLHPTPPRATRRRKLEHILLLLLRCCAVLLLAAAFARPFLTKSNASPPPVGEGRQLIILLDTSASMRREGLWRKARAIAANYIEKALPADRVAVMTFAQQPHTVVSFADWQSWPVDRRAELAKQRLEVVSPGWEGTHLGLGLTTATEAFSEETGNVHEPGLRDVALISDLQEGAKLDGLQGYDWPKGVRVVLERVDPARRGNAGLAIQTPSFASAADEGTPKVRIVNARDANREKFLLGWSAEGRSEFAGKSAEIYLPPGQTRTFLAPELPVGAAAGALRLTGDEEEFDNTTYFAAAEKEHALIAYFGSESANDPGQLLYYLQRAFPETARRQVQIISVTSNSTALEVLPRVALAVIPSSLQSDEVKVLRDWIVGGKTALLILTNADSTATLASLAGWPDLEVSEASGDYALLGEVDFNHPIFAPFADPRYSDFSRIHFWKHRRWTMPPNVPARVLAKFDDGAPALAQIPIAKGTLLALFAGWHPVDSQLALSSKFLPLMQTILDWSGGAAPARKQFEIGDSIPSPISSGAPLQWRKPDGKVVPVAPGSPFTETDLPGIYTVTNGDTGLRRFAVNLPLDESRTAPLSPDDFGLLGVPLQNKAEPAATLPPGTQHRLLQAELENRQKLWRWLIVGLLAVILVEILLGGWVNLRRSGAPDVVAYTKTNSP